MMCRRGGKGGSWALFLPRGFEGLVLFPPASLCLSPHFSLLCALSMAGLTASCSPTFLSLLNSSSNLPPFSSDR